MLPLQKLDPHLRNQYFRVDEVSNHLVAAKILVHDDDEQRHCFMMLFISVGPVGEMKLGVC